MKKLKSARLDQRCHLAGKTFPSYNPLSLIAMSTAGMLTNAALTYAANSNKKLSPDFTIIASYPATRTMQKLPAPSIEVMQIIQKLAILYTMLIHTSRPCKKKTQRNNIHKWLRPDCGGDVNPPATPGHQRQIAPVWPVPEQSGWYQAPVWHHPDNPHYWYWPP